MLISIYEWSGLSVVAYKKAGKIEADALICEISS